MKIEFSRYAVLATLLAACLGLLSQNSHALATGTTKWVTDPTISADRNNSYISYYSNQGAQGTYWVWRVQKYYPEFTLSCSTPSNSGCTANKTEGRSTSITRQWTIGIDLSPTFKSQGGGLSASYSQAVTQEQSFTIGQTIYVPSGSTAYAMIIALDKYIPAADYRGVWRATGKRQNPTCTQWGCGPYRYEMRWDNDYTFSTWKGHMVTYHRAFMCATRDTVAPRVGDGPPKGCSLPPIPY